MPDISQMYSSDLAVSLTGDLAVSSDTQLGTERVIRRLMTSQGQYIFQPNYGAGLPLYLGSPTYALAIEGVIRQQMQLETVVSQNPIPSVRVQSVNDTVTANIQYVDAATGENAVLTVPITG